MLEGGHDNPILIQPVHKLCSDRSEDYNRCGNFNSHIVLYKRYSSVKPFAKALFMLFMPLHSGWYISDLRLITIIGDNFAIIKCFDL